MQYRSEWCWWKRALSHRWHRCLSNAPVIDPRDKWLRPELETALPSPGSVRLEAGQPTGRYQACHEARGSAKGGAHGRPWGSFDPVWMVEKRAGVREFCGIG